MRAYAALAEQKYGLPVYPVVLFLLPPIGENGAVGCYHSEFMGLVSHQDYRVVRAWEIEAQDVLEGEILALVPYVPLMAGADEEVIRDGIKLLRRREAGQEMEVVLALFASFVMETERIQEIVRWNMAVLRESPWYQEILQEGRQEGWQEGRREGVEEGQRKEARLGILRLLKVRFDIGTEMMEELDRQLKAVDSLSMLRDLSTAAVQKESLEEFCSLLTEVIKLDDGA
jgi:predicted transposase YdaD